MSLAKGSVTGLQHKGKKGLNEEPGTLERQGERSGLAAPGRERPSRCEFSLLPGAPLPFIISFRACPAAALSPAFPCFPGSTSVGPGCHWNGLCGTGTNWPPCPGLLRPRLASPDGKMRPRCESVTRTEKAGSQGASERLRGGEGPASMLRPFPEVLPSALPFLVRQLLARGKRNPAALDQRYPRGKGPGSLFCPWGLLLLCELVRRP